MTTCNRWVSSYSLLSSSYFFWLIFALTQTLFYMLNQCNTLHNVPKYPVYYSLCSVYCLLNDLVHTCDNLVWTSRKAFRSLLPMNIPHWLCYYSSLMMSKLEFPLYGHGALYCVTCSFAHPAIFNRQSWEIYHAIFRSARLHFFCRRQWQNGVVKEEISIRGSSTVYDLYGVWWFSEMWYKTSTLFPYTLYRMSVTALCCLQWRSSL